MREYPWRVFFKKRTLTQKQKGQLVETRMQPPVLIVGAGSSGLAAAKNLKEFNIPFEVIEKADDVGGIWYPGNPTSSVYRSTHLISSKPLTEFTDFPMPADYPHYPNQRQVWEYFKAYARHFDLYPHIQFNTAIEHLEKTADGWQATLSTGEKRQYRAVIIANGHNWDPKYPEFPGEFTGEVLHSAQYKTPDILKDKVVLVVGAGNSGCDIAVEASQNARKTFHSVRRGYYYIPKFFFGRPADQIGEISLKLRLPLWVRRALNTALLKLMVGDPSQYGLPKPDHKLFETHPIVNSQMLYFLAHGDIIPKPNIAEFNGNTVKFVDGSEEAVDIIIFATGFKISFPFVDKKYLNWRDGKPELYLNIFHPKDDTLFVAGLIQPDSGQWGLVDYQTQLIARFLYAQQFVPEKAEWFRKVKAGPNPDLGGGIRYVNSTRHYLEVEHFSYRQRLKKLIRKFGLKNPRQVAARGVKV